MPVKPIPDGYHTITPYLAVRGAAQLIEFLKKGFSAKVRACHKMPDGSVMNAELMIGDSMVMRAEAPRDREPKPATLYMYVNDADALYKQAIQAGGKSVHEPMDQFYGDRSGAVDDPSGNQWWIATRKENLSDEELANRASQKKG